VYPKVCLETWIVEYLNITPHDGEKQSRPTWYYSIIFSSARTLRDVDHVDTGINILVRIIIVELTRMKGRVSKVYASRGYRCLPSDYHMYHEVIWINLCNKKTQVLLEDILYHEVIGVNSCNGLWCHGPS
jgi:hypothetical protein